MVAADDAVRPILGYSPSSPINPARLAPQLAGILDEYERHIEWVQQHDGCPYATDSAVWHQLEAGKPLPATKEVVVGPLLTTRWDQLAPYNELCPAGTATGCAATAMAQYMKFWNFPAAGEGSHSYQSQHYGVRQADFAHTLYDWDNMADSLTSLSPQAQRTAVATLMYHVGVADNMQYNTAAAGGSAANGLVGWPGVTSMDEALRQYFHYSANMQVITKSYGYTNATWRTALKNELDLGRPILYTGSAPEGGHAFVCDGYDHLQHFHFNFGWSGEGDGYYPVDSISPGHGGAGGNVTYTFNQSNMALLGAVPVYGLYLSDADLTFGRDAATDSVILSLDTTVADTWTAIASDAWVTVEQPTLSRAGWVRIHADDNTTGANRTATVTFTQGSHSVSLQVRQGAADPDEMCPLTVVMQSTNGQGWQGGAYLSIESPEGLNYGAATLAGGSAGLQTIMVPPSEVRSVWHSGGGTDRYINYYVVSAAGDTLVSAPYAYTTGGTHVIANPCGSSGISQLAQPGDWSVFPNPVSGTATVSLREATSVTATLLDMGGRTLMSIRSCQPQFTLDLSALSAGIYLLRLTSSQGSSAQRIIKQ